MTLLTILFYVLHMLDDLSNRVAWMNHLSLFNIFNPQNLIHGHGHFAADCISLAAATVHLVGAAIIGFRKRQLAL